MHIMNGFFKKKPNRRWTWASSDGKTKNEIDFFITGHKRNATNITVLNRFVIASDHRAVRKTVEVNLKNERTKLLRRVKQKILFTL